MPDRYIYYQRSVQVPAESVAFLEFIFKEQLERKPVALREDFCGTGAVSCAWVDSDPERTAFGVDLDPDPLAWGRENNVRPLDLHARGRLKLVEGDVRTARCEPVDLVAAENFSVIVLDTRAKLLTYLNNAYRSLRAQGALVVDLFGGPGGERVGLEEPREYDGFAYLWEQLSFDPITRVIDCCIHYELDDGTRLDQAFRYTGRLWTIPEMRDAMFEVGFERTCVYWEQRDDDGVRNGEFAEEEGADAAEDWVASVVALKLS